MSNSLVIIVCGHPDLSESHQSALKFIENVYSTQGSISYVFFYAEATIIAKAPSHLDRNENSVKSCQLSQHWKALSKKYKFPLIACISAALKRGVIDDEGLADEDQSTSLKANLREGFQLEGFSFVAESINHQQKIIEFCG